MNVIDNDPDGSGEFAVGFGDDDGAADLVEAEAKLDRTLQDVWSIVRDVQAGPLERVDHYLCECNGVIQECAACVEGHIDRRFEVASNVIDSLNSRVARSIDRRVDYVNSAVASLLDTIDPAEAGALLGFDAPNNSQVDFAAESGPATARVNKYGTSLEVPPIIPDGPQFGPGTILLPADPAVTTEPPIGGGGPLGNDCPVGKWLPPGQPGPAGWVIYSYVNDLCEIVYEPGRAKFVGWGPNIWPCGANFPAPPNCPGGNGNDTPGDDTSTGNGDDTGCIRLCQPICGPATPPPPSGPGDDSTGPGDWQDNAGGDDEPVFCESTEPIEPDFATGIVGLETETAPADGAAHYGVVTVNDSMGQPDAVGNIINKVEGGPLIGVPTSTKEPAGASCSIPTKMPIGDVVFNSVCSPENWQQAKTGFESIQFQEGAVAIQIMESAAAQVTASAFKSKTEGWLTSALFWTIKVIVGGAIVGAGVFVQLFNSIVPVPGACRNKIFPQLAAMRGLFAFVQRWTNAIPPASMNALDQVTNYSCQTNIPSTTELSAQRLAGVLTKDEWEYGVKLNGDCPSWFQRSYDGGLAVPSIPQALGLWRAGLIDELQMRQWLKRNRIPEDAPLWEWKKLTEALPGPGELMTFMTRDVVDEDAVNIGDLDQDFARKWTGTIQEWGQRQGVTDEVAKFHWRAHWLPPSTTQLFSMYHRLRPESGYIDANGHPVTFSRDQLYEALKINDLMPAYVDRMIAISHPPLALSYLRMGYVTGVISREELPGRLQDLGYTADDGKTLGESLALSQTNQRAKFLNITDGPTLRKLYLDDSIDDQTFLDGMLAIGSSQEVAVNALESAKSSREAKDRAEITKGLRRAFFAGRIDLGEYRQELLSAGVGAYRVEKVTQRDFTMMKFRYKEISLAKLCKLVGQGYLDMAEYIRRAGNLGYQQTDAAMMAASCVTELQKKRQAELAAAQRQAIADAEKAERKAERERKRQCRIAKESYGCSPAKKPTCPAGVTPPNCELVS